MRQGIDLGRLRAALGASGFRSFNQLAKEAGIAHTTISRLFGADIRIRRGNVTKERRTPAVNSATLRRLSAALRVPSKWLTGELDSLPFVLKHGLLSSKTPQEPEDMHEAKVRQSHLLARTHEALRRDLQSWYGDGAEAAYAAWGGGVLSAIRELASPISWRLTTIVPKDGDPGVFISGDAMVRNTDAVAWLEQALAPWFGGSAYLNARTLRELFLALFKNAQREPYAFQHTDANIIHALGLYDISRKYIKQEKTEPQHPLRRAFDPSQ